MDKLKLVQDIGNEICDGCGPDADCDIDCGENPEECSRVLNAIEILNESLCLICQQD